MSRPHYTFVAPYDVARVIDGARRSVLPKQYLVGADLLAERGDIHLFDRVADPASGRNPWHDPRQMWTASVQSLARRSSLFVTSEMVLGAAPRRGRPPLRGAVCIVHGKRRAEEIAPRLRAAICLTEQSAEACADAGVATVAHVRWGPDLGFASYDQPWPDRFAVASLGRTGRDTASLLAALARSDVAAIVDTTNARRALPAQVCTLASIVPAEGDRWEYASYVRPVAAFREVSAFVIALERPFEAPIGLSELNDAMALGRPVIMTRTPGVGIDIEAEGFGIWVPPGDVDALTDAILLLERDVDRRTEMGRRAREVAFEWDYRRFCIGTAEVLDAIER